VDELERRDGVEGLGQSFLTLNITGSLSIRKRIYPKRQSNAGGIGELALDKAMHA
jgi:hypothetical protein